MPPSGYVKTQIDDQDHDEVDDERGVGDGSVEGHALEEEVGFRQSIVRTGHCSNFEQLLFE